MGDQKQSPLQPSPFVSYIISWKHFADWLGANAASPSWSLSPLPKQWGKPHMPETEAAMGAHCILELPYCFQKVVNFAWKGCKWPHWPHPKSRKRNFLLAVIDAAASTTHSVYFNYYLQCQCFKWRKKCMIWKEEEGVTKVKLKSQYMVMARVSEMEKRDLVSN